MTLNVRPEFHLSNRAENGGSATESMPLLMCLLIPRSPLVLVRVMFER